MNVLTDGESVTGLIDLESVRLADPLLDVAWWAWSVSFAPPAALTAGWRPFIDAAGIDATEPTLDERIHSLQVLRMLELLTTPDGLSPQVRQAIEQRLDASLG